MLRLGTEFTQLYLDCSLLFHMPITRVIIPSRWLLNRRRLRTRPPRLFLEILRSNVLATGTVTFYGQREKERGRETPNDCHCVRNCRYRRRYPNSFSRFDFDCSDDVEDAAAAILTFRNINGKEAEKYHGSVDAVALALIFRIKRELQGISVDL